MAKKSALKSAEDAAALAEKLEQARQEDASYERNKEYVKDKYQTEEDHEDLHLPSAQEYPEQPKPKEKQPSGPNARAKQVISDYFKGKK